MTGAASARGAGIALGLVAALAGRVVRGEEAPAPAAPPGGDVNERLRALEAQNGSLLKELRHLRQDHEALAGGVRGLSSQLSGRLAGYLDLGAFWVGGDGSGIRTDLGHERLPEYRDVPDSWVFLGDPLSTAVNSRGEPASTGESRAVTFNPVGSGGVASAMLNALNVAILAGLGQHLVLHAMIDFVPRSRNVSSPGGLFLGDFIALKLAYVEYTVPTDRLDLRITAGKFDSVLGIEYRTQESPDRMGVIPSLICRYTCGRPIGLKARARLLEDLFVIALAVTNGTHSIEGFPFYNEVDTNFFKTLAARLSTRLPVGAGLELGVSGTFGAQDFQPANDVYQWHYGFDLRLEVRDLDLRAEFVQGRADGRTEEGGPDCGVAPCLRYLGAYGQVAYRIFNWLTPYARADWRDAFHRSGASFVYVSQLVRMTGGLRSELGSYVVLKAEYTHTRELGPVPEFPNDVVTSSLIVRY